MRMKDPVQIGFRYLFGFCWLSAVACGSDDSVSTFSVTATLETEEVVSDADDPAIWVHPTDPSLTRVIGTDKGFGLLVFDMSGQIVQRLHDGQLNNVDLRVGFPFADGTKPIVVATNRTDLPSEDKNSLLIYFIDESDGTLYPADTRIVRVEALDGVNEGITADIYGVALYHSAVDGRFHVFANFKSGWVIQLGLSPAQSGTEIVAVHERSWKLDSLPEGMVADDELGHIYVGEEAVAVWKLNAEPHATTAGVMVDQVGSSTIPQPDIEGMAIYKSGPRTGYLVVSSQGDSSYCVYDRAGDNAFIRKFDILQLDGDIDRVTETDGLEVVPTALSDAFPAGMMVVQDDVNERFTKNFKYVSWQEIQVHL
jgi:3-phytase